MREDEDWDSLDPLREGTSRAGQRLVWQSGAPR